MWKPTPSPRRVLFTRHQALAKPGIAPLHHVQPRSRGSMLLIGRGLPTKSSNRLVPQPRPDQ